MFLAVIVNGGIIAQDKWHSSGMGKEFPGKCCDYNQMGFFISWNRSIICELALQIQANERIMNYSCRI